MVMVAYVVHARQNNRAVRDRRSLWDGRNYACPQCGGPMAQGWVQVSNGIAWSARRRGRPAGLYLSAETLENTQSMHFRPASNMAWRCPGCKLLVVDHDKMVH